MISQIKDLQKQLRKEVKLKEGLEEKAESLIGTITQELLL
jgi:hypothetical protein